MFCPCFDAVSFLFIQMNTFHSTQVSSRYTNGLWTNKLSVVPPNWWCFPVLLLYMTDPKNSDFQVAASSSKALDGFFWEQFHSFSWLEALARYGEPRCWKRRRMAGCHGGISQIDPTWPNYKYYKLTTIWYRYHTIQIYKLYHIISYHNHIIIYHMQIILITRWPLVWMWPRRCGNLQGYPSTLIEHEVEGRGAVGKRSGFRVLMFAENLHLLIYYTLWKSNIAMENYHFK